MRFRPLGTAIGTVVLVALAIAYARRTPPVKGADAPPSEFSAVRALEHVRELSRSPRPVGSAAHDDALVYIMAQLADLGIAPNIQATTGIGTRYPVAGRVRNIVARIPGMRPSAAHGAVLLVAHYDGVAAAPAAGDDAAGVAVLLETLRAIRQGPLLPNDVIALFTDAEEAGLLGAAAFVREHAWAKDVGVILNFEARGTHGPSLMFETGPANLDVIRFLRAVPGARATSLSTAVYRQLPNDTDLSELALLERPAMNFAFIGGVERYHTAEDDIAHLSAGSVQHHGEQALALTRAFGSAALPRPDAMDSADGVFFDLPFVGIVLYPESWALPFAILALVAALGALVLVARRDGKTYVAAAIGVVMLMLSVVAAAFIAAGAAWLFAWLHATLPWGGTPQWRGIYALAIALLTLSVVSASVILGARVSRGGGQAGARGTEAGAFVALGALAIHVTVIIPGVSFLFTWPVFAAAVACIAGAVAPRIVGLVIRWVAAALIIFLLAPTIYLMVCVALGLDFTGAAVLAALTGVGIWLLAPQTSHDGWPRRRLPLASAAAALVVSVIGMFVVRTNASHPAGSAFVYAVDSAAHSAWLGAAATNVWARRRIGQRLRAGADTPVPAPAWLTRSFRSRDIVPARLAPMPVPEARVVRDSMADNARVVTARVRAPGARSIQMWAEPGVVMSAQIDDRDITGDRYRARTQRWSLEYVAPSDSGFTLTLRLRPGAEHALSIVARHSGIPAAIQVPERPPGVIPIGSGDATYVHRLVQLR